MGDNLLDSILKEIPAPDPAPAAADATAPAAAAADEGAEDPPPAPAPTKPTGKTIHTFGDQFKKVYGDRKNPPKGAPGT